MPSRPACHILAIFLLLMGAASHAAAQMFVTTGRDTLRSLPGVEVIVDSLPPELERAGLKTTDVRADVDKRLRAKGIPIFGSQSANPSAAKAYLYVHLNALPIPGGSLYAIAIHVQVRQTVRSLVTSSNIVDAVTWDSHTVVGVSAGELAAVRDEIGEHVDRFVSDWTAVH
ncbi:MAG TPA: hypothetical protein VFV95_09325 [Vicinamibacterales bacterium]|nr:hypothetical protein [Vicinamibacterales bacterium]